MYKRNYIVMYNLSTNSSTNFFRTFSYVNGYVYAYRVNSAYEKMKLQDNLHISTVNIIYGTKHFTWQNQNGYHKITRLSQDKIFIITAWKARQLFQIQRIPHHFYFTTFTWKGQNTNITQKSTFLQESIFVRKYTRQLQILDQSRKGGDRPIFANSWTTAVSESF